MKRFVKSRLNLTVAAFIIVAAVIVVPLSNSIVHAHAQSQLSPYPTAVLADQPVLYYRLGDPPGSTLAQDSSGNGHTGSYSGGVTLGQPGALAGDPDTSATFDGSTGFLSSGLQVLSPSSTIEAWISPTRTQGCISGPGCSLGQETIAGTGGSFQLMFGRVPGTVRVWLWPSDNSGWYYLDASGPVPLNSWSYIATTWDDATKLLSIYINGTLNASLSLPGVTSSRQPNTNFPFTAGAFSTGEQSYQGGIDEVAYYNSALTANRILAHYTAGTITEFPIPILSSSPEGITQGPDGNLWFTEGFGNKIGRITPSGSITEFPIPTPGSFPVGITSGSDGNLWFTEEYGNKIGRITVGGSVTEFPIHIYNSKPFAITSGPDGKLWFTESGRNGNRIGRITTRGSVKSFLLPNPDSKPLGIADGSDGNLWFTELFGNKIGRITTTGSITEFPIPTSNSFPERITRGPDGNLWFTENLGNKIGRITIGGSVTEFSIPTSKSFPSGITTGPDSNLWFTENDANNIGKLTPGGTFTEFPIPTSNSFPTAITGGPDGNVWFTEGSGNNIGRITLH